MDIKLGKYNDDPRRVGKVMTDSVTISMSPIETTDLMNPKFICDYNASLLSCNYAEVSDFSRKYFIDPPEIVRGGRMTFQFHVDVIETPNLTECEGIATRNKYASPDVVDNLLPTTYGRISDPYIIPLNIYQETGGLPSWALLYTWFDYLITR